MGSPHQLKPYKTKIGYNSMHLVSHKVRTNPIINNAYPNLKQETKLVYVHPINTTKHKQTMA
jgi:hypothetical protein